MAASLIVLAFYLYTVYAIIGKQKKGKGAAKPISRPPASAMRLKVLEIMRHPTCKARPHNADSKRHDAYWNARSASCSDAAADGKCPRPRDDDGSSSAPAYRAVGTFPCPEMAARARRRRAQHQGRARTVLNFPDLERDLLCQASLVPRDVGRRRTRHHLWTGEGAEPARWRL